MSPNSSSQRFLALSAIDASRSVSDSDCGGPSGSRAPIAKGLLPRGGRGSGRASAREFCDLERSFFSLDLIESSFDEAPKASFDCSDGGDRTREVERSRDCVLAWSERSPTAPGRA